MAKTKVAGKAKGKRGRPPIEKGKALTPAERVSRFRKNRSNQEAAELRRKARDRRNERYARKHNLEPKSTRDARKAR